jgi:hypothetical protein
MQPFAYTKDYADGDSLMKDPISRMVASSKPILMPRDITGPKTMAADQG